MSANSSIEWTDATWNPTRGCTKIAPGCAHCYAETFAERFRGVPGHAYEQGFDPRTAPDQLPLPLTWKKPRKVFVDSMSDLFHEAFSFDYIAAVFGIMAAASHHTFQILTKRPARAAEFFRWIAAQRNATHTLANSARLNCAIRASDAIGRSVGCSSQEWPLPNVWIGTSIANQHDADKNIPHLLQVPAAVRFLSVEPMVGPVDLGAFLGTYDCHPDVGPRNSDEKPDGIHWVIVGGESGHGARPCNVEWIRSVQRQCIEAGVPVFTKQLGAKPYVPLVEREAGDIEAHPMMRWPADAQWSERDDNAWPLLHDKKGGDWSEWPEDMRIRQFPGDAVYSRRTA